MNHERLRRIRNFQSTDWYQAFILRPLTIVVMLVIADWKFLTANRLTTLSSLAKLVGAWLVLDPAHWIAAAIVLQVGTLLDHLDGAMARYRRTFTKFGSFYDKVSDFITWQLILIAAGWAAFRQLDDATYLLLAVVAGFAGDLRGYMKWLVNGETERVRWLEARADPAAHVAKRTRPIVVSPPPVRSRRDWLVWAAKVFPRIVLFDEVDLFMWLGIALVIGRLDLGLWVLAISQGAAALLMLVVRSLEIVKADRTIRELEAADAPAA